MDKKSIVNDLYQAAVISVLAVGYSMLGKKILRIVPPSIQKFDLEDMGKLVAIHRSCIGDDKRVSHQTEDLTRTHKCIKNGKYSGFNQRSFSECTSFHR